MPKQYHDSWYLRAFDEVEGAAVLDDAPLEVGPAVTTEEFAKVFPGSCNYLSLIAASRGAQKVVKLMEKIGYTEKKKKERKDS